MNWLILTILSTAFWATVALAETIDPNITPTKVLTCDMPVEREDGTALAIDEIAQVQFFVSPDQTTWTQAGTNTVCSQSYDLSNVQDGTYFYTASVTDLAGRQSILAPQAAELIVKRIASPAPPSNLGWTD